MLFRQSSEDILLKISNNKIWNWITHSNKICKIWKFSALKIAHSLQANTSWRHLRLKSDPTYSLESAIIAHGQN